MFIRKERRWFQVAFSAVNRFPSSVAIVKSTLYVIHFFTSCHWLPPHPFSSLILLAAFTKETGARDAIAIASIVLKKSGT